MTLGDKIKVLIVEDRPLLRAAYCRWLSDLDYSCRSNSGFGSLEEEIREYQPQVVLMDTNLPGKIGYEECAKLRKMKLRKKLKIIGMSVHDYEQEWLQAGAHAFWRKNQEKMEELEQAVKRVLEK